jgi:hypothetical protein
MTGFPTLVHLTEELERRLGDDILIYPGEHPSFVVEFEYDHVPFALVHPQSGAAHKVTLFCRFGQLPEDRKAEALQRLMEINFMSFSDAMAAFSFDPVEQDVVYGIQADLGGITSDSIVDTIQRLAAQADEWNDTFYLQQVLRGEENSLNQRI